MNQMKHLLKLSHVPRWAIIDTAKTQSVADHSFRVMAIGLELLEYTPVDQGKFLLHALTHDVEEAWTGDIPTPHKNKPIPKDGVFDVDLLIKLADLIEAITFLDRYGVRSQYIRQGLRGRLGQWVSLARRQWPEHKNSLTLKINAILEEVNRYE